MVEMQIDDNNKLQIYAVGDSFTAVLIDKYGNVKQNKEITPQEMSSMLLS